MGLPRYRAGQGPLPGWSTGVEGSLYRMGPGRASRPGAADGCVTAWVIYELGKVLSYRELL
jgi:hypothetical protein